MNKNSDWTVRESLFAAAAIAFVLILNGAVPFFTTPTLGQAVWSTGFSQSFANGPLNSIYARDFGIPKPAAIAFGLAGAWPASLLIRLGLHPSDAYSGMAAFWLLVAFFSACRIARMFGATPSTALLGGVTWMSMPIIWAHAGYSMLSLGIGLLPFYFLAPAKIFLIKTGTDKVAVSAIGYYFLTTTISVFMDGYSFMMFATGASILLAFTIISRPENRSILMRVALPVHLTSFTLAYVLFGAYVGESNYDPHLIRAFRGWGLDLSFIAIPTKGMHWLPDLLGLSMERTDKVYFGDDSVWATTFSLPVILAGLVAWWPARKQVKIATGILLVGVFGFYMALGPSLKIDSKKPESIQIHYPGQKSALMHATMAVMPTGNEWISKTLPGFNVMRASYRWSALGVFAFWLLVMIRIARTDNKNRALWGFVLLGLIVLNLPDMPKQWQGGLDARTMFHQIDRDLVSDLRQRIRKGEVVAFIPGGNDIIANYLAPRAGFRTFNIGGDKNLSAAQTQWPSKMMSMSGWWDLDPEKASIALKMLTDDVDVLVVPYFDMFWSPQTWPCFDRTTSCILKRKEQVQPFISSMRSSPYVEVTDSDFFVTIRLLPEFTGREYREAFKSDLMSNFGHRITFGPDLKESGRILTKGWHAVENNRVWSQADSRLALPVPKDCRARQCFAVLKFNVFGASQERPVAVNFSTEEPAERWNERIISTSISGYKIAVPIIGRNGIQKISISVPDAMSPRELNGSSDGRVLGIALQRVEFVHKSSGMGRN